MSYNPQNPNGQAASADSAPVVIASDQSVVPVDVANEPTVSISGTVVVAAASLPLPAGAATAADQTGGSQKTQVVDSSGNIVGTTGGALDVAVTGTPAVTISGTPTVDVAGTVPVSAAALPLPSGAATAAGQTGGSAKTQVVDGSGSVIGSTANALDVNVSNSPTVEVSGTVGVSAAALPLPSGAATSADQTNGTAKTQLVDGSGNVIASTSNALNVDVTNTAAVSVAGTVTTATADTYPASSTITVVDTGSATAAGQNGSTIITGTATAGSYYMLAIDGKNVVRIQVTGTWAGTLGVEVSADSGATWVPRTAHVDGVSYDQQSVTANCLLTVDCGACTNIRARATAFASGTATVRMVSGAGSDVVRLASPIRGYDNTSGANWTLKVASTAVASTDTALAVGLHPSTPLPAGTNALGTVALTAGGAVVGGMELVDSGGTNKAAISSAGRVSVDGSGVTQPVSGTVVAGLAAGSNNIGGVEVIDAGGTNKLAVNAGGQGAVLPAGGDLTSGAQLARLTDGANTANVQALRAGWNAVTTVGGTQEQTSLTAGSLNSVLVAATDVSAYAQASLEVTGTWSGTLTVQGSNDNATYTSALLFSTAAGSATMLNTITANGLYAIPLWFRYLRVTMTSYISGTANGTLELYGTPRSLSSGVSASQSGTWTMQPGNTPNTSPWLVSLQPAAAGGWSVSNQAALTNTAVAVKASVGQSGGYGFYNPSAAIAYVQVFNTVSGSVTVGTTAPLYSIPVPPTSAVNMEVSNGIAHSAAISVAATTTPTGSTAPGSALTGFLLYK
jgi:hypothetical protein